MVITRNQQPPQQPRPVSVSILPQDPLISQVETLTLSSSEMGPQLNTPRLKTEDSVPVAQADANGNYQPDVNTPQFDQVNTHATVASTVLTYEKYMGHPTGWNFEGPLTINPHAGEGKTAYYSRWDDSINFCQWESPSLGKTVKTSQSFDIASHETGHAILDGIRPGILGGREGSAFHEGFGDSSAILHVLQFDSNLEKILAENGGDFSKPSLVTRLAEEFGTAFNKEDQNPKNDDNPYYRTALNDFKYKKPSELPWDSYPPTKPEEVLTSEPHSFSRIWSGAFYSMLGALYNQAAQTAPSQLDALKTARDALGTIWGRSLDHLPASNLKFRDAARAMIREADALENGKYLGALAGVMLDRNLLTPREVDEAQAPPAREVPAGYDWVADKPLPGADGRTVLTYRAPQAVEVDGLGVFEVSSGLTQVFDRGGQLVSQTFTPVTSEDIEEARLEARELVAAGKARVTAQLDGPPLIEIVPRWECC